MTEAPSDKDLRVALETLTTDSKRWDECSDALSEASTAAATLALRTADFGLAFFVHSAYVEVQELVTELLGDGSRECKVVAEALREARDVYQREEDNNVHAIRGIW